MTNEECYKILGVSIDASDQDIKDAYHFLVQSLHPDKFASADHKKKADEKLKELNIARDQLLKSVKNPRFDSNQPTRGRAVSPDTKSNKRRLSCLARMAIGVLALLVIAGGVIGIIIWSNRFKEERSKRESEETAARIKSERARKYSETERKVAELSFTPNASMQFQDDDAYYRIQLMEMASYSNGRAFLKVSICNVGNKRGAIKMSYWYTPVNGQNTIDLYPADEEYLVLRPGACTVQDNWSPHNVLTSFRLTRPFGKLNISQGNEDILGVIDLKQVDAQGYIQPKE